MTCRDEATSSSRASSAFFFWRLMCSQRFRYFGVERPESSLVGMRGTLTSPDSIASTSPKSETIHSNGRKALSPPTAPGYIGVAE